MFNPDLTTWLGFAVSVILPALVALVTKQTAHPGLKAFVLLLLSAVTGFAYSCIEAVQNSLPFSLNAAVVAFVMSFGTAVLAHYGLLSPAAVTGSQGKIQQKVSGGVG
jgi:hypothetical protein